MHNYGPGGDVVGNEYTFGVARIRALESALFSQDTINQLIQCKTYEDCIRFLKDKGWGNGNYEQTLSQMLETEHHKTWTVLNEIVKDSNECRILTINNEFHNLKAAIKSVCSGQEIENIFISGGTLKPDYLMECIRQGSYDKLPSDMTEVAREATEVLLQTGDGQLCDIIIDKATLKAISQVGQNSDNVMIKKYAETLLTNANIKIAIRCATAGKDGEFAKKAMVECDGISVNELCMAVDNGIEDVCNYLENSGYKDAVEALNKSKSVFECWCDNRIVENIKKQKYNSFTIGPIIAYVLARENEIKTVKIILSCKSNGFDDEFIKERIRVMYA